MKSARAGVELRIIGLAEFLGSDEASAYDSWSLSDFSSYCTDAQYRDMWRRIANAVPNGARVCERQLLLKRAPEPGDTPGLTWNHDFGRALKAADRSFVYDILVAEKR